MATVKHKVKYHIFLHPELDASAHVHYKFSGDIEELGSVWKKRFIATDSNSRILC
jgi:hypothetical protein